jgi:hypothetical protein
MQQSICFPFYIENIKFTKEVSALIFLFVSGIAIQKYIGCPCIV